MTNPTDCNCPQALDQRVQLTEQDAEIAELQRQLALAVEHRCPHCVWHDGGSVSPCAIHGGCDFGLPDSAEARWSLAVREIAILPTRADYAELRTDRDQLREQLSGAHHTIDMHQAEARRLRRELAELQEECEHRGRQTDRLRRQPDLAGQRCWEAQHELEQVREEAKRLRRERDNTRAEITALEQYKDQVAAALGNGVGDVGDSISEINQARLALAAAQGLTDVKPSWLRDSITYPDDSAPSLAELTETALGQLAHFRETTPKLRRELEQMWVVVDAAQDAVHWFNSPAPETSAAQIFDALERALDALTRPGSADTTGVAQGAEHLGGTQGDAGATPATGTHADSEPDQPPTASVAARTETLTSLLRALDTLRAVRDGLEDSQGDGVAMAIEKAIAAEQRLLHEQGDGTSALYLWAFGLLTPSSPATPNQTETPGGGEGEQQVRGCATCLHQHRSSLKEPCATCIEDYYGYPEWKPQPTPSPTPSPVPGVTAHESLPRRQPVAVVTRHETEMAELEGQLADATKRAETAEKDRDYWQRRDGIALEKLAAAGIEVADPAYGIGLLTEREQRAKERAEEAERRVERLDARRSADDSSTALRVLVRCLLNASMEEVQPHSNGSGNEPTGRMIVDSYGVHGLRFLLDRLVPIGRLTPEVGAARQLLRNATPGTREDLQVHAIPTGVVQAARAALQPGEE